MVEKDAVRRGYDDVAAAYASKRSTTDRERAILEQFLDPLAADAAVLDAGCGQGEPVLRRTAELRRVIGIDLSRAQLKRAETRVPEAALLQGDLARLPVADDTVDAVTALHSLIHVPIDEHRDVIDEFARVLRPGGRLLLTEGTGEWHGSNPDWLGSGVEMQWAIAGAETTRDQLDRAGFRIDTERTAGDQLADEEGEWAYFLARLDED